MHVIKAQVGELWVRQAGNDCSGLQKITICNEHFIVLCSFSYPRT